MEVSFHKCCYEFGKKWALKLFNWAGVQKSLALVQLAYGKGTDWCGVARVMLSLPTVLVSTQRSQTPAGMPAFRVLWTSAGCTVEIKVCVDPQADLQQRLPAYVQVKILADSRSTVQIRAGTGSC
jgi:hypothetical protein